jgi:hypothetical protein
MPRRGGFKSEAPPREIKGPRAAEYGMDALPPPTAVAQAAASPAAAVPATAVPAAAVLAAAAKSGTPAKKAVPAAAERRRPGRPPSKPPAPPLEKKGVVDSPTDPSHRLEFAHGDPTMFKSLFAYFKNLKAREIHLRCSPRGLTFFARDHAKISRVVAHVAGEHVNWHYCEGTFWLGINRDNVEKMFTAIDKSFFKITILQTHEDPGTLTFVLKDAEIDKECNYRFVLSAYAPDENLYEAEACLTAAAIAASFPVEFTLTAKQFKKSVGDADNYADKITFEKIGAHPLQLTYAIAAVVYNEVYRSAEKIRLRSSIADTATFRCTVNTASVKSLAASMVTDDIRILCREDDDILFRSAIDTNALVVSTLMRCA